MADLPMKLKIELAKEVHKDIKVTYDFFRKKMESTFLSWVGHLLVPHFHPEGSFLYQETDPVDGIYFIKSKSASFVIPRFENKVYFEKNKGDFVGLEDLIYDEVFENEDGSDLHHVGTRKFTVIAPQAELLRLNYVDYFKIQNEFPMAYESLCEGAIENLAQIVEKRIKTVEQMMEKKSETQFIKFPSIKQMTTKKRHSEISPIKTALAVGFRRRIETELMR